MTDLILLTISREKDPPIWWLAMAGSIGAHPTWHHAPGAGIIEHVLEGVLDSLAPYDVYHTREPYILRLDDDEWVTEPTAAWLRSGAYLADDHWKFPRLHRWTADTAIVNDALWPDRQTRLSVRSKAGGRQVIHGGSPYGGGRVAEGLIVHDKFLKPLAERQKIAAAYDAIMPGAGTGSFAIFNTPETCAEEIRTVPFLYLDTPWRPDR